MKRRSYQSRARRDRKAGISPYARKGKVPYRYPFPTGKEYAAHRMKELMELANENQAQAFRQGPESKGANADRDAFGEARERRRMARQEGRRSGRRPVAHDLSSTHEAPW